jgi:hypothetical protein
MTDNLPTIYTDELIKEVALDIGKETVFYIETMYPEMFAAVSASAKLSVRNHIFNQIMAAIKVNEEGKIRLRLAERKAQRRYIKKIRTAKNMTDLSEIIKSGK